MSPIVPLQTVRAGAAVLQVIATFGLIWAASAGYVFREMGRLKKLKVQELQEQDTIGATYTSDVVLTFTVAGVWTGGIALSAVALQVARTLSQQFGRPMTLVLYSIAIILFSTVFFVTVVTYLMLQDLEESGVIENGLGRIDIGITTVYFLMIMFVFLMLLAVYPY